MFENAKFEGMKSLFFAEATFETGEDGGGLGSEAGEVARFADGGLMEFFTGGAGDGEDVQQGHELRVWAKDGHVTFSWLGGETDVLRS